MYKTKKLVDANELSTDQDVVEPENEEYPNVTRTRATIRDNDLVYPALDEQAVLRQLTSCQINKSLQF